MHEFVFDTEMPEVRLASSRRQPPYKPGLESEYRPAGGYSPYSD
jgi:hypothetical protein